MVNKPSKKKILRHVSIIIPLAPQGGMRARLFSVSVQHVSVTFARTYPVASRPPKAPAMEAAET